MSNSNPSIPADTQHSFVASVQSSASQSQPSYVTNVIISDYSKFTGNIFRIWMTYVRRCSLVKSALLAELWPVWITEKLHFVTNWLPRYEMPGCKHWQYREGHLNLVREPSFDSRRIPCNTTIHCQWSFFFPIEPLPEKQQRGGERALIPVEAEGVSIEPKPGSDTPRSTVRKWSCGSGQMESREYCEGSRTAPYLGTTLV